MAKWTPAKTRTITFPFNGKLLTLDMFDDPQLFRIKDRTFDPFELKDRISEITGIHRSLLISVTDFEISN